MARGAEGNPLGGIAGVGLAGKIGRDQPRHIGKRGGIDGFAGGRIWCSHVTSQIWYRRPSAQRVILIA
ncbi:hypothetical protein ACVWY2_004804 [Bradyrhizobium sp. JR6.1]